MSAPAPDREHLVRVIADRHGMRVQKDDPLFAIGTICEAYSDEAGRRFDELVKNRIDELETAAARIEKRTGQLVAQVFNDHLSAVRNSLQTDITLAGAKANEIVYRRAGLPLSGVPDMDGHWTPNCALIPLFRHWLGITYGQR